MMLMLIVSCPFLLASSNQYRNVHVPSSCTSKLVMCSWITDSIELQFILAHQMARGVQ